ncbi:MAG: beta-xylosidase [Citrobacter freundii]|nr:MAG: beta-xylosidase [Citrobacter freundii]
MKTRLFLALCVFCCLGKSHGQKKAGKPDSKFNAYLFAYFTGNSKEEESIHFAISKDGYNFRALNNDKAIISSAAISSTGGVRDPHILRGQDGKTFYMVATDMVSAKGWNSNRAMVLLKSTDLINWTSSVVNIQQRFKGQDSLLRVWAPQTIYDDSAKKYMIYFSMKHGKDPDKIYYSYANNDFTDLATEPKQLFFSPTNGACIDGDITRKDGKYYLFFKTEGEGAGIKVAVSSKLTHGYVLNDRYVQQTKDPVEGAGVFKLNGSNDYILMYDVYTKGKYQFTRSKDLVNFSVIDQEVKMNFHPRHGTVMPISQAEAERLSEKWLTPIDVFSNPESASIRKTNIVIDTVAKTVFLPVFPGTDLKNFDPAFPATGSSARSAAYGQKDFTKGPVDFIIKKKSSPPVLYKITAAEVHNPVLDGLYADPDILYSEKTKQFYIYPTSDGFTGWSGNYFKTFSSKDLVNWKDEGVILDLPKDVSWANRNAWAPTIVEKKINGQYKYFYYFTAAQKVGVAVADNPTGPFKDSGKPLIDALPAGVKGGQQIDPDVFTDPVSGKSYLYWGNGYMAGAELNDDMISLKPGTMTVLTPDASFREGTHVFWRNGKYYFMWSEDDTRSVNYKVRYGLAESPLGKITVPAENLVIEKDPAAGIYATGHNSTIRLPGTDEWYIVYHRFQVPKGITMGDAAGYNREVCIDKMSFDEKGNIIRVVPTIKGITPVTLK